jgi:hypothetical protein
MRINSDHDQELHREGYAVIQRVYLYLNQSPTVPMLQELEGSPQIHEKRGREIPRTQNFKISARIKTEIEK